MTNSAQRQSHSGAVIGLGPENCGASGTTFWLAISPGRTMLGSESKTKRAIMDIAFSCTHCHQQLEVDASAAGSKIQCPSCAQPLVVPEPDITMLHHVDAMASSAGAKEEKHFSVPVHDRPTEVLVKQVAKAEEVSGTERTLKIRAIKRVDCIEVGKDRFEEVVSSFLNRVGQENVISINTMNYSHIDMATRTLLNDFGVLIVYKG
jgi:hypothetical protein